jgi:hypothetical protein
MKKQNFEYTLIQKDRVVGVSIITEFCSHRRFRKQVENYIREMTNYSMRLRIKEIREKLSTDGKLFDDLIFSVNPEDLEKCCYVAPEDYATYDMIFEKIWVWLFRINKTAITDNFPEDIIIYNIIRNIEHEWIHRLDSKCVGERKYSAFDKKVIESIVKMQQDKK